MASIEVDSTAMREKANVFTDVATSIRNLTEEMFSTVSGLKSTYTGTAADTFYGKFDTTKARFQEIDNTIMQYADFLNQAADAYDKLHISSTTAAESTG